MVDVEGAIVARINLISGITAWRNRAPVGFDNTSKIAVVIVNNDAYHLTARTRASEVQVRVYGGSSKLSDLRSATDSIISALNMKTTSSIAITGNIRNQYLPPEPESGWLTSIIRLSVRTKE